jgi:hypothetical protein
MTSQLSTMSNAIAIDDHVKVIMMKPQKLPCPSSSLTFSLTSKLFARIRPLLALSARAAPVLISPTLNSRTYTTVDNMAPAVANGSIEPSGTSSRGSQSSKMHSKVVRLSSSLSYLGIDSGALNGRDRDPRRSFLMYMRLTHIFIRSSLAPAPQDILQQYTSPVQI